MRSYAYKNPPPNESVREENLWKTYGQLLGGVANFSEKAANFWPTSGQNSRALCQHLAQRASHGETLVEDGDAHLRCHLGSPLKERPQIHGHTLNWCVAEYSLEINDY